MRKDGLSKGRFLSLPVLSLPKDRRAESSRSHPLKMCTTISTKNTQFFENPIDKPTLLWLLFCSMTIVYRITQR